MLNVHIKGTVDRLNQQVRAAKGMRGVQPVLMIPFAHLHPQVAGEGNNLDVARLLMQGTDHHRIRTAGVHVVFTRIRSDEQDVDPVFIQALKNIVVAVCNRHAEIRSSHAAGQHQNHQRQHQRAARSLNHPVHHSLCSFPLARSRSTSRLPLGHSALNVRHAFS